MLNKNKILSFVLVMLFIAAPFSMMPADDDLFGNPASIQKLPTLIYDVAIYLKWGILFFLLLVFLFEIQKENRDLKISAPVYFFALFYFIQFIVATIDGFDYVRFFLLTTFSLLIPPVIGMIIKRDKNIIIYLLYGIVFFIMVSIQLNGHLIFNGYRFMGFMTNPNTYGISAVFWTVIILIAQRNKLVNKKFFIFLFSSVFLTMFFTGSRNAMIGVLLLFFLNSYHQFSKLRLSISMSIVLLVLFFIISDFLDLSSSIRRIESLSTAVHDSGRDVIWQAAYPAIKSNFLWGNGMDANFNIPGFNLHNCYLLFVLNMGMVFTVIALSMYLLSISSVFLKKRKVPVALIVYLAVYSLMNIGEDFFVGINSSAFIYILFIYGFINYYITDNYDTA